MKSFRVLVLLVPLFLTACGLSQQQKADYASVERAGVSPAIYDKMVHGDELSLYDIKSLARAGVNQAVILRYLRDQQSVYMLNTADVTSLKKAGLSESVIDYMLRTPQLYEPDFYGYGYGPYWDDYWGPYYGGFGFYGGGFEGRGYYGGGHFGGYHGGGYHGGGFGGHR